MAFHQHLWGVVPHGTSKTPTWYIRIGTPETETGNFKDDRGTEFIDTEHKRERKPAAPSTGSENGIPGSIFSYPNRGIWGNKSYRGNTSGHIVKALLEHYKPTIGVIDPMEGSGTARDVCAELKIPYVGKDLSNGPHEENCIFCSEVTNGGDFVFLHPPYHKMVKYDKNEEWAQKIGVGHMEAGDCNLSTQRTVEDYYAKMEVAFQKIVNRMLYPGGYLALQIGDLRKAGKYYHLLEGFWAMARHANLDLVDLIVKVQHKTSSAGRRYKKKEGPPIIPILHEFVVVWRKPE